mmetsp:Transcript_32296/g.43703  ORF Transcript_32296/g.43703 Transcript_32296/m.43703 type:complete len:279 (+) Transcript_32296:16-852(+)
MQTSAFLFVNLYILQKLYGLLEKERTGPGSHSVCDVMHRHLSRFDQCVILWAGLTGFSSLFIDTTYVISYSIIQKGTDAWFTWIWRVWGYVDPRFMNGDSFVLAMSMYFAFIHGPLCLVLCWTVVTRHAQRHTLTILLCCIQIFSSMLYIITDGIEEYHGFESTSVWQFICFVLLSLLRPLFAVPILMITSARVASSIRQSEDMMDHQQRSPLLHRDNGGDDGGDGGNDGGGLQNNIEAQRLCAGTATSLSISQSSESDLDSARFEKLQTLEKLDDVP